MNKKNKAYKSELKKAKKHIKKAAELMYDYYNCKRDIERFKNQSEFDKKEWTWDHKLLPIKDEGGCSYNYNGDSQHDLDRFL